MECNTGSDIDSVLNQQDHPLGPGCAPSVWAADQIDDQQKFQARHLAGRAVSVVSGGGTVEVRTGAARRAGGCTHVSLLGDMQWRVGSAARKQV